MIVVQPQIVGGGVERRRHNEEPTKWGYVMGTEGFMNRCTESNQAKSAGRVQKATVMLVMVPALLREVRLDMQCDGRLWMMGG